MMCDSYRFGIVVESAGFGVTGASETREPLEHGGRLREAAGRYQIPQSDWLDLSTGINPLGWPVPEVPARAWLRLPEDEDGLETAAARYYGTAEPLPVAGSQAAIAMLPRLRPPCRVGIPGVGYREHAHAWADAGHRLVPLDAATLARDGARVLDDLEVLVVINPNNPTGQRWSVERLLDWRERLAARGGWLVVDEAFMDARPEASLAPQVGCDGLILLRSLGKFFGLAGARVGFVLGPEPVRTRLCDRLGPWTLSGPARHVARLALSDRAWQRATRLSLSIATQRLRALLDGFALTPHGGTELFQWVPTPDAGSIQDALARAGIWVRRFDQPASLRFGLPGAEPEWARLEAALCRLDARSRTPVAMSLDPPVRCDAGRV